MSEEGEKKPSISFKKRSQAVQLRRRKESDSDDEKSDEETRAILQERRELQKLRERPKGVSVASLTVGKKLTPAEENDNDPFKRKTGGILDMKELKGTRLLDTDGTSIGTAFSTETNRRDEDAEMMKYIEKEVARRKGIVEENEMQVERMTQPEDALYAVPDHLRLSSTKKSEEMLSNQMLSGIPEVDLGIEVKIKNIEATEEAKQRLLRERMNKKDLPSQFVPTNMAVNFVQHNRFNIEDPDMPRPKKRKEVKPVAPLPKVGDTDPVFSVPKPDPIVDPKARQPNKDQSEKATDDFHFEKFKKQFKRY